MKIKRWIGVLLCMLLCIGMLPTMAFAANVTSIQVNGTDILSAENNTVPCGSGSAVYDPATNTLTLNNAEITSRKCRYYDFRQLGHCKSPFRRKLWGYCI